MRYLITGGCGFLGSNLAAEVLRRGAELFILDNLSRLGSCDNLTWIKSQGAVRFYHADIRSFNDVDQVIADCRPDVIFHLAGQVAMTTSVANPRLDFEVNVLGGINVLECARRRCPQAIVTYSSTNKVYGDLGWIEYAETSTRYVARGYDNGFNEELPLRFESPYGCSKGAIDQYMTDYSKMFGLRTIVFRHSSIFGGRQFSSFDQGWVGWFVKQALDMKNGLLKEPFSISGNGKQVRDILFASDLVNCYFSSIENIDATAGECFNIGGGAKNSLSLLELFALLEAIVGVDLKFTKLDWRKSDQKIFIANNQKALDTFQWTPKVDKVQGVTKMIEWISAVG